MLSRRLLNRGHCRPLLAATDKPARATHGVRFISGGGGPKPSSPAITTSVGLLAGAGLSWAYVEWSGGASKLSPAVAAELWPTNGVPNLDNQGQGWRADEVKYAPAPSAENITKMLNESASSYAAGAVSNVANYDVAQLASNSPCEDAYVHGRFSSPWGGNGDGEEDWMAWAVFDGHCGWQTSTLLTKQLMPFVQKALRDINKENPTDAEIQQALQTAFTKLDDMLITSAKATIEGDHSFPTRSGGLSRPSRVPAKSLHIASTGDCRAVVGSKDVDNNKWAATFETVDQTGASEDEKARIRKQFPDEPDILAGGRIWGMQPARTFGDGGWKWDKDLRARLRREYNATALPSSVRYSGYKTGPYLTALPVVTTVKLPEAPSFMILATDGLWDTMSSEEAVDLVGRWCDWKKDPKGKRFSSTASTTGTQTPTVFGDIACRYDSDFSTFQDPNAAVHLMRNGLGGARDELVRGALAFISPAARYIRDDMTVQVVFFGDNK
ncbi:protein serine/threonine phosphatase 2C [Apiospora phragmitis]|uniref:Protein serine/threonine phosphatase 2C n=1 Tax=Apiospora phragmitis TaxID=2905665 RepID=A0ABR1TP47_9PEZI